MRNLERPADKANRDNTGGGSSGGIKNTHPTAPSEEMFPMDVVKPSSSKPSFSGDLFVAPIQLSTTTSSRTFTPVSTMQRLAHEVGDDLPMSVIATNALDFVAAWRRTDEQCAVQVDLIHDCLSSRHTIETNEEESRWRLQQLLISVTEQLYRFVILSEYDKFAVFCVENEPVWRQAARQLQKENDARLNTTKNIYARFLLEDTVVAEKLRMLQEANDYVVSLCLIEREQHSIARMKAMARRRCQSASQMVTPASTPHLSRPNREGEAEGVPSGPSSAASSGKRGHERAALEAVEATQRVKPLTAVKVDNYRKGWRAMMGHLTNGERGRPAHQNGATTTAAVAAAPAAVAAPAPAKGNDGKHKSKSPEPDLAAHRKATSKGDDNQQSKVQGLVFPSLPKEKKPDAKWTSREEKDPHTPLLQMPRDDRKAQREGKSLSPSPQTKTGNEQQRGHRRGSDDAGAAAERKVKKASKAAESQLKAVDATPPRRADDKRDSRDDKHHRRH
jgi:hypothetical protein